MVSDEQAQADFLANAVATAEGCGVQVEALVSKLKGGLQRLYANVSSRKKLKERSFGELVGFLCAEKDPLLGYSSDQTRTGAELALTLAMGHGIEGDYVKATSSFPTGPDGKEVDLTEFSQLARSLSLKLITMMKKRADKLDAATAKTAASTATEAVESSKDNV